MTTSSNQKRTFWRNKCRRALAEHISSRLGFEIPPDKIRLQPRDEDPYRWHVADHLKPLFKSNLSSGSVGNFQKICHALKAPDLIEAIHPEALQNDQDLETEKQNSVPSSSFAATIQRLEKEKQDVLADSQRLCEKQEQNLLSARVEWEAERRKLQEEISRWKDAVSSYDLRVQELKRVVCPALETLNLHLPGLFVAIHAEQHLVD
ncbi:hypothetical protein BDV27DRAFT_160607 [Aspergillus caelatus]|uniref:Uncharacterized protein n=1 Tax=Aspergillus caelatus TaxID=61420 RepID=A0A5N6ZW09_9EURO|nr:uncharacterized protein BDV27DRAFT_160607 [Aspergillus caelatus]KAE8361558.1 hypothetical protein BDV27DRAFT_160607 [Aspergillus caelatus]